MAEDAKRGQPPAKSHQQVDRLAYVLTPIDAQPFRDDLGEVSLASYIGILWRRRSLIIIGTILCGSIAILASRLMPEVYQATATLWVAQAPFTTELKMPVLSVETYQAFAQSEGLLARVREALIETGIVEEELPFGFEASLQLSKERRDPIYLPLIELTISAGSPGNAMLGANTWAEVLTMQAAELAGAGKKGTLDFIEEQFPKAAVSFRLTEDSLKQQQDYYEEAGLDLDNRWRQKLLEFDREGEELRLAFENQTEDLVTEFWINTEGLEATQQKETERLILEFLNRWKPDLMKAGLQIKERKLAQFEDGLAGLELEVKSLQDRRALIEKELRAQPKLLVLSKAITDEALWERVSRKEQDGLPKSLDDIRLRSEAVNPIYQSLAGQLIKAQIEHDTLVPKRRHLQEEIARLRREIDQLSTQIMEKDVELFELRNNRQLGLATLIAKRTSGLKLLKEDRASGLKKDVAEQETKRAILQAHRKSETSLLNREADLEITRRTRDSRNAKKTYGTLAEKFQEAMLARAEKDPDVKLGSLAVLPSEPASRRTVLITFVALTLGLVLSVGLSFALEYVGSAPWAKLPDQRSSSGLERLFPSTDPSAE